MRMRKALRIGLGLWGVVVFVLTLRIVNVSTPSFAGMETEYLDYFPLIGRVSTSTPTITPTVTGTLPALPDLGIASFGVTYYGCPWGGPGKIMARVVNVGEADAGHFAVDINFIRTTVDGVEAGGYRDPSVEFSSGPIGSIGILVDSEGEVWESNEGNNFIGVIYTPPPPCE